MFDFDYKRESKSSFILSTQRRVDQACKKNQLLECPMIQREKKKWREGSIPQYRKLHAILNSKTIGVFELICTRSNVRGCICNLSQKNLLWLWSIDFLLLPPWFLFITSSSFSRSRLSGPRINKATESVLKTAQPSALHQPTTSPENHSF